MPPSKDIFARLNEISESEQREIYKRLVAFTAKRLRKGYRLRRCLKPEDIVQEAITSVAEGKRKWNPVKHPDLTKYLSGVISSLISNESTLVEHKYLDRNGSIDMDEYPGFIQNSLDLATSAECEKALGIIIHNATSGDKYLPDILEGLIAGLSPAEIAQKLHVDRKDVYRLSRTLRRRIVSAMARHECWEDILG